MKDGDRVVIVRAASGFPILRAHFFGKHGTIVLAEADAERPPSDYTKVSVDGENRVFTFPKKNVRVLDAVELLAELTE